MKTPLNKLIFLVLLFFALPIYSFSQLDSLEMAYIESIEKFQEKDSFVAYFNQINKLRRYYKKNFANYKDKMLGKKIRAEKTYTLLNKFKVYREPENIIEIHKVRSYFTDYIYWTKKYTGEYTRALNIALEAAKYASDPVLLDTFSYYIEMQIGIIYDRQGDESRALLYFEKCLSGIKFRKKYKRLSFLYSNMGNAHKRLNEFEKAKSYFNLGLKSGRKINCVDCILANKANLRDLAYSQRDYTLFIKLASEDRKFLESCNPSKKTQDRILALDENLGNYYFNHEKFENALSLFQKVKSAKQENNTSSINRELAKVNLKIAQCFKGLGNIQKFRKEIKNCNQYLLRDFNGILPPDSILYAESNFIDILSVCFDFFEREYILKSLPEYLDSSIITLEKAIKVRELLDQKIIYSDSKSSFASESKEYVDKAIRVAFEKHEKYRSNISDWRRIRKIFNASKDQILKDKIYLHEKIRNLDSYNKNLVDSLITIIVSELGNQGDKKDILEYQDKIERITGIKLNNQNQVELKSDYVEYLITKTEVFLLSRIEAKYNFLKLGTPSELNSLIDSFNREIILKNKIENTNLAFSKLSNFLLPPQIKLSQSFIIIPDGKITTIPFDLLFRNNRYLIEDHTTSVRTHYLQKKPDEYRNSVKIFCVSPEYSMNSNISDIEADRTGLYSLPFAKFEVDNLKSIFSSSFEVDKTSMPIDISRKLEDANVFHFTGHAKVNKDSAYLVLNNENGVNRWSYDQIYHNNFDLSLVTLSACETGLGEVQYGDGLNSVARSFLGAGSDAVVYSLWTVNDMSTSSIMKDFYTEIENGVPIDLALRQAKLNYINRANPETLHPYYWGGFVAAGDMSSLQSTKNFLFRSKYLFALGIVAIVYMLLNTIKTKHL